MFISKYFVYFTVFSFFGWIYECIYETVKHKKWDNRGFLYGPICPIYGIGASAIIAIAGAVGRHTSAGNMAWWQIFLVAFFGSIVLEYVTSYVLEKQFHAIWWDYSDMPLNIHGRVCFPASLGFGIAGIFVVKFVGPWAANAASLVPPIVMEGLSLVFVAIVSADLTLTVNALTDFTKYVDSMTEKVNTHMDAFVDGLNEKSMSDRMHDLSGEMSAKLAEERERFTLENAKEAFSHSGNLYRNAISRVRQFHLPKTERHFVETAVGAVKSKKDQFAGYLENRRNEKAEADAIEEAEAHETICDPARTDKSE